jgi:hypothetical protein
MKKTKIYIKLNYIATLIKSITMLFLKCHCIVYMKTLYNIQY